jgi:hypothetical protein
LGKFSRFPEGCLSFGPHDCAGCPWPEANASGHASPKSMKRHARDCPPQRSKTRLIGPGRIQLHDALQDTGNRRMPTCSAAPDVPGDTGRGTSRRKHQNFRRSPQKVGEPHKVIISAVAACKSRQKRTGATA